MNKIILHISDLHVSLKQDFDGTDINVDSYLLAQEGDESLLFIERFLDFTLKETADCEIHLLITGDITNRGEQIEFEFAKKYLDIIVEKLSIDKDKILLIPGDHDLNRREIKNQVANNPESTLENINEAKFGNFKKFYKSFLNKDFDPNSIIIDNLVIQEKIQLLGINSAYKIDLKQKDGAISLEKFEEEFKQYDKDKGIKNIFCCHHNVLSSHEDKKSGQWEPSNRARLLSKLQEKSINFIFSGNEHTSSLEKYGQGEITVSDSGPLTSKNHDSAFKIYIINIDDNITLTNKIYGLVKTGAFDHPYHWEQRSNIHCRQDDTLNIFIKESPKVEGEITELVSDSHSSHKEEEVVELTQENKPPQVNTYYNSRFTDDLYKKVKELKIFHTGHFHWSETSRAHNWIDVSKLMENKNNLNFLQDAIIDVLDTKIEADNIDLIIGLGYEGNILATKTAIKFNKPYTFLPYSYRHHEHHKSENQLNFDNNSQIFKSVLIVTDVVNDGRTIRKLIKKREEEFFSKVEKIYVISLFYTGEFTLNNNILNFDFIKNISEYDLLSDEEVNNIEFYTVKKLKVEKCPYGRNFREECFIYKDELSCVNLFYDEARYLKD
jgi:orotate phosphoribosyltransferase/3',5'-cyclic AMP phosphodiesterase CpdA